LFNSRETALALVKQSQCNISKPSRKHFKKKAIPNKSKPPITESL